MISKARALVSLGFIGGWKIKENTIVKWWSEKSQPTEEEIQAKIAELEATEPLRLLRVERNQILQQSDWEVQRNTERNIIDSNLIDYRNALRDLPQEIEKGNIPAPTLDENGMLVFEHWPNRYEINIEDEPTANNSANTV